MFNNNTKEFFRKNKKKFIIGGLILGVMAVKAITTPKNRKLTITFLNEKQSENEFYDGTETSDETTSKDF